MKYNTIDREIQVGDRIRFIEDYGEYKKGSTKIIVSVDNNLVYFNNDQTRGCYPYRIEYVPYLNNCTLNFQRREATICDISQDGHRIARGIAILNPGDKDNLALAKTISLGRAMKTVEYVDKADLTEQAKGAVVDMPGKELKLISPKWIVISPLGHVLDYTLSVTRRVSQNRLVGSGRLDWRDWYGKGFRCIKVETYFKRV